MDKQEAKLILQSYRSNGRDANDPAFAEALAMAKIDPELRNWLEQEQAMDKAISARLHEAPVPADLRYAILSGLRSETTIVRPPPVWWKSPAVAWAAAIILIFGAALLIQDQRPNVSQLALLDYRTTMRKNLETLDRFDLAESRPTRIESWLNEQGVVGKVTLPGTLMNKKSMGCRLFPYKESQSALICFQLPNMETVHLFVIQKSAIRELTVDDSGEFGRCGDWDTCSWEQDGTVYLLLGKVGNDALKQLASR